MMNRSNSKIWNENAQISTTLIEIWKILFMHEISSEAEEVSEPLQHPHPKRRKETMNIKEQVMWKMHKFLWVNSTNVQFFFKKYT